MRILLFLASLFLCAAAHAGDILWIAEAVPAKPSAPPEPKLEAFAADVEKGLGIPNLDLIEEKKRDLVVGETATAKFKSDNLVTIECLSRDATRYQVKLTVADKAGAILTTETHLAKRSPVIIHGPSTTEDSHLVFIFEVR